MIYLSRSFEINAAIWFHVAVLFEIDFQMSFHYVRKRLAMLLINSVMIKIIINETLKKLPNIIVKEKYI